LGEADGKAARPRGKAGRIRLFRIVPGGTGTLNNAKENPLLSGQRSPLLKRIPDYFSAALESSSFLLFCLPSSSIPHLITTWWHRLTLRD
jgi:hypothetical protein